MILVIKHVANEGPGTIEDFFKAEGLKLKKIELYRGESLPQDVSSFEAIVVMGGPMNVYEEEKYPFLKSEDIFIKRILKERIPFLGICLGSQLLAKACGAKVTKASREEIGWFKVHLTKDGKNDPLFNGLPAQFEVFQWHGDTFAIPPGGKHLAASVDCQYQAFKAGPAAYGLQFHVEVTKDIIEDWVLNHFKDKKDGITKAGRNIIDRYPRIKERFDREARMVYENFSKLLSAEKVLS